MNELNYTEIIANYSNFSIQEKLDILRKYSKNVIYNELQQIYFATNNFLEIIISDILFSFNKNQIQDVDLLTYIDSFLFFNNLLANNSKNQHIIFQSLFKKGEKTFGTINEVMFLKINDNKVKKFLLSILYHLFLYNTKNFNSLEKQEMDLLVELLKSVDIHSNIKINYQNEEKDIQEVNDWMHVIIKFILLSQYETQIDNSLFISILNKDSQNFFLEMFRDFIDYAKDSNTLSIKNENLIIFIEMLKETFYKIEEYIENFYNEKFSNYEKFLISNDDDISHNFRKLMCLVDIISVFILHNEHRELVHKNLLLQKPNSNSTNIFEICYKLLKSTDEFYVSTFRRNKSLTKEEQENIPKLREDSIFYSFQTNVLKFLSNFAFKNELMKNSFIESPHYLYYFLNHMKLDKCNPFKKEWCVLMVKSLSESSYKIQSMIEQLKPQEIDAMVREYIVSKKGDQMKFDELSEKTKKEIWDRQYNNDNK